VTTQTQLAHKNHRQAVRFFWACLIGATTVSLVGNVTHSLLPYIPRLAIQIGAAAVPPVALLAAVHGIALAVRAGASGRSYCWAVGAVSAIGLGAFAVSFLALRDLMQVIGYSGAIAWVFPALVDTGVAVSTMMLFALGDKPVRRSRTAVASVNTQNPTAQRATQRAKAQLTGVAPARGWAATSATVHPQEAHEVQPSMQSKTTLAAKVAPFDTDIASELIASRATTQPVETVIAVLAARRDGASINAAAKASRINYRTAQRIVQAAEERRQQQLAMVG